MADRAWTTQRLANRTPTWAESRLLPHSTFQQYMNSVGLGMDELLKYNNDAKRNRYVTSANLDLLDVAHVLQLPNDYTFGKDARNIGNQSYVMPQVEGFFVAPPVTYQVEVVSTLADFWDNALPTRVEETTTSKAVAPVLPSTQMQDLISSTPATVVHPGRLLVTIAGGTAFVDYSKRTPMATLFIEGTTLQGLETSERMYIPYNGVFLTKKLWSEVTRISYHAISPGTTTIQVDSFGFNIGRETDSDRLSVSPFTEKILYHALGTAAFGSTHKQMEVAASDFSALHRGNDALHTARDYELGWDNVGVYTNVSLNDMAIQPFTGRVFAIDNDALYVFGQKETMPDCRGMSARSTDPSLIIDTDQYTVLRDTVVNFASYWRYPTKRIMRNRWSITKPDGTTIYLDINGTTVSADQAWIPNLLYTELEFGPFNSALGEISHQRLSYTLDQRGTWFLKLEVLLENSETQTDIVPIQVLYRTALKRLVLPAALLSSTGIAFDSDQHLWLLNTGIAYKVRLATDNCLIDPESKVVYFHEEYDSVKVYESLDKVD